MATRPNAKAANPCVTVDFADLESIVPPPPK